ncbi:hypothetical protein BC826DRAFT_866513, partial [Russula brevipes]
LAKVFQNMLKGYGLEEKILAVTANNVCSNNTQRQALAAMDNTFEEENHICCFNHTLQL